VCNLQFHGEGEEGSSWLAEALGNEFCIAANEASKKAEGQPAKPAAAACGCMHDTADLSYIYLSISIYIYVSTTDMAHAGKTDLPRLQAQ
jgi:hypothetical protein